MINLTTTPSVELKEFPARYTVGPVATTTSHPTGYGELLVKAISDEDAIRLANAALLSIDSRLGFQLVLEQEIKLSDGWHTFTSRLFETSARPEPRLVYQDGQTTYQKREISDN